MRGVGTFTLVKDPTDNLAIQVRSQHASGYRDFTRNVTAAALVA